MNSIIQLLIYFFTPIKLYGGDGGSGSEGSDNDSVSDKEFSDAERSVEQNEARGTDEGGLDGTGDTSYGNLTGEKKAQADKNTEASNAYDSGGLIGWHNYMQANPVNGISESEFLEAQAQFDALDNDYASRASFSDLTGYDNIASMMEQQAFDDLIGSAGKPVGMSDISVNRMSGMLGLSKTTTVSYQNAFGGWNVEVNDQTFGIETMDSYSTAMDGSIMDHTTTIGIGNSSLSYNTHYWNGNNTQFGFGAEVAADALEAFGATRNTVRTAARAVEVIGVFAGTLLGFGMIGQGFSAMSFSRTYGLLSMSIGLLGTYNTLNALSNFEDQRGDISPGSMPSFRGDSIRSGDIGEVSRGTETEDTVSIQTSYDGMNLSMISLPPSHTQKQLIKPQKDFIMGQTQQTVFIDYRGGLSEVLDPHLIGANEGSKFTNIAITTATMKSKKKGNSIGAYAYNHFKYLPNGYKFGDTYPFSMVKLGNFMYLTTENPAYTKVYQLDYQSLTADATVADLIEITFDAPATDPDVDAIGTDELEDELWEEYTYAYTYYDRDTGFESAPKFSTTFLKKTEQLKVDSLSYSTNADVDAIRLYRIGGYSQTYRLITEIENDGTGVTSYTDSLNEEYNVNILDSQNLAIIDNLIGLTEHKGTFFAFKNNEVFFTRPGKPNTWSNFNSIRVGGSVSGLASTPIGLLIFTDNNQTYLLGGTDKYNYVLSTISKTIGCIDYKSINNVKNTAIWLDYEGLVMSVGSAISNISKEKANLDNIGEILGTKVYNNVYYLIGTNYSIAIDFRYNMPSFSKLEYGLLSIDSYQGKLYAKLDDGNMYEDTLALVGDELELTYKTPMFIGNSYDMPTEFEKINLVYKGNFEFIVYIDGVEVSRGDLSSAIIVVEEIKLPSGNNEGLSLEMELIGTGEIKSFRYLFSNINTN